MMILGYTGAVAAFGAAVVYGAEKALASMKPNESG
jgi:hypothetical protein